jgi:hypothetical protein
MIGKCPHCGIDLTIPPFNDREVNEVMIVMIFRGKIDSNQELKSITDLGHCEICRATLDDFKEQNTNQE